ncbi:MAG: hypothetical protein QM706_09135 [Nitrospira sp.]
MLNPLFSRAFEFKHDQLTVERIVEENLAKLFIPRDPEVIVFGLWNGNPMLDG